MNNVNGVSFLKDGIIDIDAVTPIILANIDNETSKDYNSIREYAIRHGRDSARWLHRYEGPKILYIKDYGLKITYSDDCGTECQVEQVKVEEPDEGWYSVDINEPVDMWHGEFKLRMNSSIIEAVLSHEVRKITPELEITLTLEDTHVIQFDIVNLKINCIGKFKGSYDDRTCGDMEAFDREMRKDRYSLKTDSEDLIKLIDEACKNDELFAEAVNACKLREFRDEYVSTLMLIMAEYIAIPSIKYVIAKEEGRELLRQFHDAMKFKHGKILERLPYLFHKGTTFNKVLGINKEQKVFMTSLLFANIRRFYQEWRDINWANAKRDNPDLKFSFF